MFKLTKETYSSNQDFGSTSINDFIKAIGATLKEKSSYGYAYALYKGFEITVHMERDKDALRVYSTDLRLQSMLIRDLSDRQVQNLMNKLDELIEEKRSSTISLEKRRMISNKLYKLGIIANHYDECAEVNGFTFYIKDSKIGSYDSLEIRDHIYMITTDESLDMLLNDIKTSFVAKKKEYEKALAKVTANLDLINEFFLT